MAIHKDREHYIPIRQSDMLELLCQDLGADHQAVAALKKFDAMLSATFHYEYYRLLNELKDAYAPFDPDHATQRIRQISSEEREKSLAEIYQRFVHLMERANFKRLTLDELADLTKGVSHWGLNMDVDFSIFERLEVFVRGDAMGTRTIRRWWKLWRREEISLPVFQRLVLFVKMKPSKRLPADVDTNTVFLKVFKDIPKVDMEMLLPGSRLRMPAFDRFKLGSSLIGSGAWIGYNIVRELLMVAKGFGIAVFLGPLSALLGYGYKQWFGYQSTRTVFSLRLAQSLYYQTLGTNQTVLFHLLDEAEEQECREAILAYFCLWRHAGPDGWTQAQIDDCIETDLDRLAHVKVDFEIDDALAKLERLKLVRKSGDRYTAEPIDRALELLDHAWDNYFRYNA